jgi:hypothetical protein
LYRALTIETMPSVEITIIDFYDYQGLPDLWVPLRINVSVAASRLSVSESEIPRVFLTVL